MKIISLQAENIKRLTAVNITPEGNVIQITGKNGEGKSSVIDSIWMALGGKAVKDPIHKGADKGSINIDLGKFKVKRSFTEKGSYLSVETADGAKYGSPQKMLDDLIGKMAFDPMEFMRLKDQAQYDSLAQHTGLDLTEFSEHYEKIYTDRRDTNRDHAEKEAEFKSSSWIDDMPDDEVDVEDLLNQINMAREQNIRLNSYIEGLSDSRLEAVAADEEIEAIKKRLEQAEENRKQKFIDIEFAEKQIASAEKLVIEAGPIEERLRKSQYVNANIRNNAEYRKLETVVADLKEKSDSMTAELNQIKDDRAKVIQEAKMPIEGLSFGKGFITYNDIPLSQASSAEQIRVTVAIAMAMNPELRVIRIEDGSLLDSTSMKIIDEMAKEHDYQFWIERVDESGKVGIVIDDGQVSAIDGAKVDRIEPEPEKKAVKKKAAPKKKTIKKSDQVSAEKIAEMDANPVDPIEINKIKPTLVGMDFGSEPSTTVETEITVADNEIKEVKPMKPEVF